MNFSNPENFNYDVWLHWNVTGKCNFKCDYCFGSSAVGIQKANSIKIDQLTDSLDNSGKIFRIGFTGGEPFLVPNFIEACKAITINHFISINTHLVSNKVKDLVETIPSNRILFIHASLHLAELEKKNLIKPYVENFNLCGEKGINVYAEAVAFPPLIKHLEKYKNLFDKEGIEFSFGSYYGKYNNKRYPESYTEEEIKAFGLTETELNKYSQKGNLCNAGLNAAIVYTNGDVYPCFQIKEKIGNIYEEIHFKERLVHCPSKYCGCPLNVYDEYLYNKAKSFL